MIASFFTKFGRFEVGLNFNTLANVDFSLMNSLSPTLRNITYENHEGIYFFIFTAYLCVLLSAYVFLFHLGGA